MEVYIDNDYKCHVAPSDGLREFEISGREKIAEINSDGRNEEKEKDSVS